MTSLTYSQRRVVSPTGTAKAQEWSCVFCSYLHTSENNEASFHCCKLCQTARCHYTSNQPTTTTLTTTIVDTVTPIMYNKNGAATVSPSPPSFSSSSSLSSPRDSVKHSPWVLGTVKNTVASSKNIMPRCVDWNPKEEIPLDEWIATVRPSKMSSMDCEWIGIQCNKVIVSASSSNGSGHHRVSPPAYRRALRQITNQIANTVISPTKSRVFAAVKKKNNTNIIQKQLPQNAKVATTATVSKQEDASLLGKWMFFVSTNDVDATWERIARATARGELGSYAKIAPARTTIASSMNKNRSILSDRPILCCVYVEDFTHRAQVKHVLEMLLKLLGNHVRTSFKPDFYGDADPALYKKEQVLDWNDATTNDAGGDDDQRKII